MKDDQRIQKGYEYAKETYARLGVDVDKAMGMADAVPISMQCWQGDDVVGFDGAVALTGGIAVTGDYPGRARNLSELQMDIIKAFSLIPGKKKLNLHASYAVKGDKKIDRDAYSIEEFLPWIDFAKEQKIGLDFNPTYFSHPMMDGDLSLSSPDDTKRRFWIEHGKRCREIALAFAQQQAGHLLDGLRGMTAVQAAHPGSMWLRISLGVAEARAGRIADADRRFEAMLAGRPTHRALVLSYAQVLAERNTPSAGARAVAILRPLLSTAADDLLFQQAYARANEIAGDDVRAGEAWAEAAYLNGRPEQALVQLNNLKKRSTLDYYARSRIDARIAAITPTVLELRRQGIRDEDATRGKLQLGVSGGQRSPTW